MSVRLLVTSCVAGLTGIGAALALAACESSQSKNKELAAQGATILKEEEGLQVTKTSSTVDVLNTAVLSDANGAAVVVTLKNNSTQALRNVPVEIQVKDAKGKTVFKNTAPGLHPSLTSIPVMQSGETVDWVNDQILASRRAEIRRGQGRGDPGHAAAEHATDGGIRGEALRRPGVRGRRRRELSPTTRASARST